VLADPVIGSSEDDMRPRMFALAAAGRAFALATIVAANGGPRPVGSQLVIDDAHCWGFLSGGCIEADIALHARAVIAEGAPVRLVYGEGSPFIDMRLPCGGRLEVLVERVAADDPALVRLSELTDARRPARWKSDGLVRRCNSADAAILDHGTIAEVVYQPMQRLVVVGSDPFALAIAELGRLMNWEVLNVDPGGPNEPFRPDPWTAIAVATHDMDADHRALVAALASDAGYVGVMGARRRLPQRLAALKAAGVGEAALARLRAPIGLALGATNAREVAVAVIAEIVAVRHGGNPERSG
jgi:xanthine dehydrogenase accessory factor